jgi:hypothetical protein
VLTEPLVPAPTLVEVEGSVAPPPEPVLTEPPALTPPLVDVDGSGAGAVLPPAAVRVEVPEVAPVPEPPVGELLSAEPAGAEPCGTTETRDGAGEGALTVAGAVGVRTPTDVGAEVTSGTGL